MEKPVILKFIAQKDSSVSSAFAEVQKGSNQLQSQFTKIASESEALFLALQKLRKEAEQSGRSFAKGGKESQQALSETTQAVKKAELQKAEAREKARKDLEFALREEEKYRRAVVEGSRQAAQATQQAADEQAAALKKVQQEMDRNTQLAKELGPAMAVGLTAAGAALGGLASYALQTANSFEQMEAQLVTAMGSTAAASKAMADAQKFASQSPFDVKGVVKATVQLEVYGQRSQTVLPRVAALAAGMGKSIEDASLVVGKALSGSLEGFESLRNEYGITTRELVRFGAEQNKAGGIMVQSAAQTEKARKALLQIIDLRYGDAVARQAATLSGQLEKVADEMTGFAGEIGKGAAEVVKFGAAFVGGGFEMLRKLPQPVKTAAGALLTLSAGMAAAGAAALTFGGGLAWLLPRMVAAQSTFVAMGGAQGALFVMEQHFNKLGLSAIPRMVAALAPFAGYAAIIGGITLAVGTLMTATNLYIDTQERLQAEMREQSRLFQESIQQNRDLAKAFDQLNNSTPKGPIVEGANTFGASAKDLKDIEKILAESSASDFAKYMAEATGGAEDAKKMFEALPGTIKATRQELETLQEQRRQAEIKHQHAIAASKGAVTGESPEAERIKAEIRATELKLQKDEDNLKKLDLAIQRYDEIAVSIDKMGAAGQRTADVLKYKDKIGDLKSMNEAYGILAQQIALSAAELKKMNEPLDRDSLLSRLQSGKYDQKDAADLREKVLAHLDLLDEQERRQTELHKKNQEGDQKALEALKANLAEAKAAREVNAKEVLANLAEQFEIAKRLGTEGEKELSRIRQEAAAERARAQEEDLKKQQKQAKAALDAAKSVPVATKASERGTQAAVDAYDAAIGRVQKWISANQALIAQFPDLGDQGKRAIEALKLSRAQADVARTQRNFSDLQKEIRGIEERAISTAEKIEALGRVSDLVKAAKVSGDITEEQASEAVEGQAQKRKELQRQEEQEKLAHRQKMHELERQAAERELAIAETLADGSLRSNDKILVARERLHQFQIRAIELEKEAAIKAGADKVRAEEEAAAKIKAIEQQKTADLHAELKKRYDAEKSRLQGIVDENQTEDSLDFGSLSFGGTSDDDTKRRARKAAEKELEAIERAERFRKANPEAVSRMAEEDRQRALRAADPSGVLKQGQGIINSAAQGAGPQTVNNNTTNTVNIFAEKATTKTAKSEADVLRIVKDEIATDQYYDPDAGLG